MDRLRRQSRFSFVNNGEAVISNTVYDLGKEIETDVKMKIEALEK